MAVLCITVGTIAVLLIGFWFLFVWSDMEATGLSFGRVMAQRRLSKYERELQRRERAERSEARIKKQEERIKASKYL
jgi:hypothetical protein